jgi:predicted NUDIX family NTP pyrophosphohydrolase
LCTMPKISAGILLYRRRDARIEVFLIHPGGPLWAKKDLGAWSVPKGEPDPGEDLFGAALREFHEETGFRTSGEAVPLTARQQRSGKLVYVWAVEGECDASRARSNAFSMEWPPGSGRMRQFPENDRAAWFDLAEARRRIWPSQLGFLDELQALLRRASGGRP